MSLDRIDAVSRFCLGVVLGSYRRLAPQGRVLSTLEAQAERDVLLLSWAMSNDVREIAQGAAGRHLDMRQRQALEATVRFGQISGSIDARETLLQQHVTSDLSLFVVNEAVPSKESLMRHRVVAWALKLARDEIVRSLHSDQGYNKQWLEERLAVQKAALAVPTLKAAISGRLGRTQPEDAAINYARRSKSSLHSKAADSLSIQKGLRRLAPFALRHVISDVLFDRLGNQRLLELAAGLALAEALSIASGHHLAWNSSIASDGVMAKVGPFAVGWHKPMDFGADEGSLTVSTNDIRTGSCISFIRCADASGAAFENEAIRLATESLVAACRMGAKKGPRYEETPLVDCAVVMRRLFNFEPEATTPDRLAITGFDEMTRGRFLELGRRLCRKANLN